MSRAKKILATLCLCLVLEFLFVGLLTHGVFAGRSRYVPYRPSVASPADGKKVNLKSPLKNDARFVFEDSDDLARYSGSFLAARDNTETCFRNCRVALTPRTITLAPKVSRYIFESVLNL